MLADYLWLHMGATFPHKWTTALGDDPRGTAGKVWAAELAGMTREQIDAGLDACRNSADPWPPSLPEFKARCLSIPTLAAVKLDVSRAHTARAPFTCLVLANVDGYAMRQSPMEKADRMIRDAYDLAREHVMRGGALPGAVAGELTVDQPAPGKRTPEVAAAAMGEIAAELGIKPTPEPIAPTETIDKAAVEADLQRHYGDRKSAAAGDVP